MDQNSSTDSRTPVAIVGAGPTGLSLALGLARHGVRSVLIEKNTSTSKYSKAPGIHLRTLEIFRQWGVGQRVLDAGRLIQTIRMHAAERGDPLFTLDFSELDGEAQRPGILLLEQGETEKLLLEAVQESGMCEVRFGAEAVKLVPREDGAEVTIREDGVERSLEAEFVVGCDGAHSFVRRALDLSFEGITYSIRPMLADVRVEDDRDALPWPRVRNARDGLTVALRLRPELWRIIRLDMGEPTKDEVPDAEVHRRAGEVLGKGPVEVVWANRFQIHRRSSPRFRVGRVLLAGDAAHIHSPVGGQGMNAGIQDAHNLAWKLAYALRGGDRERLLDSYDVERQAVVVGSISRYTDLLTRLFLQAPSIVRSGAFVLLDWMLALPRLRSMLLRRTAMIDLGYPASPLLDSEARAAGVRLPNPVLYTGDGKGLRLYDLLSNKPVILEVAENRDFTEDLPVDEVIRIGPGGDYFNPSGLLRGLLGQKDGWILVRPDAHVAWARDHLDGLEVAVQHALGATDSVRRAIG